jgi:hypothetical protein
MRFLILLRMLGRNEAACLSNRAVLELRQFDQELMRAGVLLAAERLRAGGCGARVILLNSERIVTAIADSTGPIAGFWLIQAKSKAEAIEWARRCPKPEGVNAEAEIWEVIAT